MLCWDCVTQSIRKVTGFLGNIAQAVVFLSLSDFENSDVFFQDHKTATFKATEKLSIEDVAIEKASSSFQL